VSHSVAVLQPSAITMTSSRKLWELSDCLGLSLLGYCEEAGQPEMARLASESYISISGCRSLSQ